MLLKSVTERASKLTVKNGAELVQVAVDARHLGGDLVNCVHEVLQDEDVVRVVLRRRGASTGRWRRRRSRTHRRGLGRHLRRDVGGARFFRWNGDGHSGAMLVKLVCGWMDVVSCEVGDATDDTHQVVDYEPRQPEQITRVLNVADAVFKTRRIATDITT